MNMYFISRHELTPKQEELAVQEMSLIAPEDAEYNCINMGDVDAFNEEAVINLIYNIWLADPDALVVSVHSLIFHECIEVFGRAGIFNNVNRAPVGEKPQFKCTELAIRWRT